MSSHRHAPPRVYIPRHRAPGPPPGPIRRAWAIITNALVGPLTTDDPEPHHVR